VLPFADAPKPEIVLPLNFNSRSFVEKSLIVKSISFDHCVYLCKFKKPFSNSKFKNKRIVRRSNK
jgi:hypothetical protein